MKYEYITATGKTTIETDGHFHGILSALDREDYNADRKHRRRNPLSLDSFEYEGACLSDRCDHLEDLIRTESHARLREAIEQLTPGQQTLVREIYFEGIGPSEIARKYGVDKSAISHRLSRVHKRLKKLLQ